MCAPGGRSSIANWAGLAWIAFPLPGRDGCQCRRDRRTGIHLRTRSQGAGRRQRLPQEAARPELARLANLQVEFHVNPAIEAVRTGYDVNVIGNINYTLERWPNFKPSLRLLVDYDARGGKSSWEPADSLLSRMGSSVRTG